MNGFSDEHDWSDTLGPGHKINGAKIAIGLLVVASFIPLGVWLFKRVFG